jgi:hypothetical protein
MEVIGQVKCRDCSSSSLFRLLFSEASCCITARDTAFRISHSSNSVSAVTELWAGRPGFDSRQGQGFFSSPPRSDRLWDLPSLLSNGYRNSFPGVKLPGREAVVEEAPLLRSHFVTQAASP